MRENKVAIFRHVVSGLSAVFQKLKAGSYVPSRFFLENSLEGINDGVCGVRNAPGGGGAPGRI